MLDVVSETNLNNFLFKTVISDIKLLNILTMIFEIIDFEIPHEIDVYMN